MTDVPSPPDVASGLPALGRPGVERAIAKKKDAAEEKIVTTNLRPLSRSAGLVALSNAEIGRAHV